MQHSFQTSDGIRIAYHVDDFTDPWKQPRRCCCCTRRWVIAERWYAAVPALVPPLPRRAAWICAATASRRCRRRSRR